MPATRLSPRCLAGLAAGWLAGAAVLAADAPAGPAPVVVETLANGLTLAVKEHHAAPVAALRIYVRTGSLYEQEYLGCGISHVFEHLLHGGTTSTRSEAASRAILDRLGGDSNAYTTPGHTGYHLTTPAANLGEAIALLADWLKNSTFPPAACERELKVVIEELYQGREEPLRVLNDAVNETMFSRHPLRYPVIGYPELVRRLTRADVVKYYERMYVPNNMIVVAVGDFAAAAVLAQLRQAFGDVERRPLPAIELPAEPRQLGKRGRELENENVQGAYFRLGYHTVSIAHPDLYALDVLSYVLTHGQSARLVKAVVEDQRLADELFSYSDTPEYDAGVFMIGGQGAPATVTAAVAAVGRELARLKTDLVSPAELERAQRQKVADDLLGRQSAEDEAIDLGVNLLTTGNAEFNRRYLEGIRSVTAEQVRDVARRYLTDDNLTVVTLRPPAAAAPAAAGPLATGTPARQVKLANGLTLLVKRNPGVPAVCLQAYFLAGVRCEAAGQTGVSRLTGSLLTRGTATRSADDIARTFDALGGRLSGTSGNHTIGLTAEVLKDDFPAALAVFADVLEHASFPDAEFAKVKDMTRNAIAQQDDDWQSQVTRLFLESYFTRHPYGHSPLGTTATLDQLTAADVRTFFAAHVVPARGVLAVFGDVDEAAVVGQVEKALAGFQRPAPALPPLAPQPPATARRTVTRAVARGISSIYVGYPGLRFTDVADRYPLLVLDAALEARLYQELRGQRNLVYTVLTNNFAGLDPGCFGVIGASTPANMPPVEDLILQTAAGLKTAALGDAELAKARAQCLNREVLANQTNANLATQAILDELYGLGYDHAAGVPARLAAVTAADVLRVANAYLNHPLVVRLDGQAAAPGPDDPAPAPAPPGR